MFGRIGKPVHVASFPEGIFFCVIKRGSHKNSFKAGQEAIGTP